MFATIRKVVYQLRFPPPSAELLPGVRWGRFDELFTPAFWRGQAWQHEGLGTYRNFRLGQTLREETAACLLGGYGMKAEVALIAYRRLQSSGLLDGSPSVETLEGVLSERFDLYGSKVRYRFPRQKARYLAACLQNLGEFREAEDDRALRDQLLSLPGIGPKTASWIVRNYRSSDAVAIIDIHILRAGRLAGVFGPQHHPSAEYELLEDRFLQFAKSLEIRVSLLDAMIWDYMRWLGPKVPSISTFRK
jgi:thermostable 8-oxoguanine DNA glycosylase